MGLRRKKQELPKDVWDEWLSNEMPTGQDTASVPQAAPQQQPTQQSFQRPVAPVRPAQAFNRPQQPQYRSPVPQRPAAAPQQYQPVQRPVSAPMQPAAQPHPVAPTPVNGQPAQPTISINIHLPKTPERLRKWWHVTTDELQDAIHAVRSKARANRKGFVIAGSVATVILLGVFVPPMVLGKHHDKIVSNSKTQKGSSKGSSAGGNTSNFSAKQPDFAVVAPQNKQKLAKSDGVNSAFDSQHDSYSYRDSLQNYGIIVSEQPIPKKFANGQDAVDNIAPSLAGSIATSEQITTSYGKGYVITNEKYGSQEVVANVHAVIVFIQATHTFKNSDWVTYIDNLQ